MGFAAREGGWICQIWIRDLERHVLRFRETYVLTFCETCVKILGWEMVSTF